MDIRRSKAVKHGRRPELRIPSARSGEIGSGASLLKFAREMEALHPRTAGQPLENIAAHYKEYLYGSKRATGHKKRA